MLFSALVCRWITNTRYYRTFRLQGYSPTDSGESPRRRIAPLPLKDCSVARRQCKSVDRRLTAKGTTRAFRRHSSMLYALTTQITFPSSFLRCGPYVYSFAFSVSTFNNAPNGFEEVFDSGREKANNVFYSEKPSTVYIHADLVSDFQQRDSHPTIFISSTYSILRVRFLKQYLVDNI